MVFRLYKYKERRAYVFLESIATVGSLCGVSPPDVVTMRLSELFFRRPEKPHNTPSSPIPTRRPDRKSRANLAAFIRLRAGDVNVR